MRIEGSRLVDQSQLVKNDQNQVTGVKTAQGTDAKVVDAAKLPDQVEKGDLFVKVGDEQVVQLTLSEPASREELMSALSDAIKTVPEGEIPLKEGMINAYLGMAKSQGEIPTGTELAQRVTALESELKSLEGHHGDEHSNPMWETFKHNATKLGLTSVEIKHLEHAFHDLHSDDMGKKIKGMGQLIISLNHGSEHFPKIRAALEDTLKPMLSKLDSSPRGKAVKSIINKVFLEHDPAKSISRVKQLAVLLDGKADWKDLRAGFEVLNDFGPEIKALLPEKAQRTLEKIELYAGSKLPKLLKSLGPMMENSDFSKALLKFMFSSDAVGKASATINFMNAVGKTVLKDSKTFGAVAEFMKMNSYIEDAWRTVLKGTEATGADMGTAIVELANAYQMKATKFALDTGSIKMSEELMSKMGITKPAGAGDEALEMMQKQASTLMQKMGMNDPDTFKAMMKKLDGKGVKATAEQMTKVMAEQAGELMGKMGASSADEALSLLSKLGAENAEEAIKLLDELGLAGKPAAQTIETLGKLGAENADDALKLMKKLGSQNIDEAVGVMTKLGVSSGEAAVEAMTKLGAKNADEALQAVAKLGAANTDEAVQLMTKLGAKNVDDAVDLISKIAPNAPKAELLKMMDELGLDSGKKALELMKKMGSTDLQQVYSLFRKLGVQTAKDAFKHFTKLGVETAQDAIHLLSKWKMETPDKLLKTLGTTDPAEAIAMMKKMGVNNFVAAGEVMSQLGQFGVKNGDEAIDLIKNTLKVKDARAAVKTMGELGAKNAGEAGQLMAKLGAANADEALQAMSKLGAEGMKAADVLKSMDKFALNNTDEAADLMAKLGASTFKEAVGEMDRLGFKSAKDAVDKMAKLGVENADDAIALLKKLSVSNVDAAIEQATKLGVETAKEASETLTKLGAKNADKALDAMRKLGVENVDEALDLMKKIGADNLSEASRITKSLGTSTLQEAAELGEKKLGKIAEVAEKLGLKAESKAALMKMLIEVDEKALPAALELVEKVGANPATLETAISVLKHLPSGTAKFIFTNPKLGEGFIKGVAKMGTFLEKAGIKLLEVAPKLAKGLGKAIPAVGGLVSGYDAVKFGKIAATGQWGDTKYTNPDARALALFVSGINAADTGLAIAEAFGVGNVAFPVQLGLAGASIVGDIMVDYYKDKPMPKALSTGIRAASVGVAVTAPFAMPGVGLGATAVLANIYKDELAVVVDELWKKGKAGVAEIKRLASEGYQYAMDSINSYIDDLAKQGKAKMAELKQWAKEGYNNATTAINNYIDGLVRDGKEGIKELKQWAADGFDRANRKIDEAINYMWEHGGIKELAAVYNDISGMAGRVKDLIMDKLSTAWNNSSWDNGYKGIRDLISEMWDEAKNAGYEARKFVYDMAKTFDAEYAGDYVPDFTYDWMKP